MLEWSDIFFINGRETTQTPFLFWLSLLHLQYLQTVWYRISHSLLLFIERPWLLADMALNIMLYCCSKPFCLHAKWFNPSEIIYYGHITHLFSPHEIDLLWRYWLYCLWESRPSFQIKTASSVDFKACIYNTVSLCWGNGIKPTFKNEKICVKGFITDCVIYRFSISSFRSYWRFILFENLFWIL